MITPLRFSVAVRTLAEDLARDHPHNRLRSRPDFQVMARHVVKVWGPQPGLDGEISRILHDMGRLAAGVWAVYLEMTPGGLTLTRLTELMIQTRVSGPGRARTLMTYLRFIRFIEPAPAGPDGREKRFVTTPALRSAFRARLRGELEARRNLHPSVAWVLERFDDEAMFTTFFTVMSEISMVMMEIGTKRRSALDTFSERYAGMIVLGEIMQGGDPADTFPPRGPVHYSLADIANRCATSRAQVQGLLKTARRKGLLIQQPGGGELVGADLREAIETFVAGTSEMVVGSARIVAGNMRPDD